jgi:conjugative transposon TraM protein
MDKDSAAYYSEQKSDPYLNLAHLKNEHDTSDHDTSLLMSDLGKKTSNIPPNDQDPNEARVYEKLQALQKVMDQSKTSVGSQEDQPHGHDYLQSQEPKSAIEKLQNEMMSLQGVPANSDDPELHQLNGMLEKILDIQHPERVNEKLQQQSAQHQQEVFAVTLQPNELSITTLARAKLYLPVSDSMPLTQITTKRNRFYSLEEEQPTSELEQNAIQATIDETQTVMSGSTIKLHIDNAIFIKGILIPKGQLIYGTASLEGERLQIAITNVHYQNNVLPVSLTVYDLDGIKGIYSPGALTRDVAKQSTDQAVQSLSLASMDPSIGAQAASAGIQAAKSLIGKKTKLIKVTLTSGYHVLLKDNNQKNN